MNARTLNNPYNIYLSILGIATPDVRPLAYLLAHAFRFSSPSNFSVTKMTGSVSPLFHVPCSEVVIRSLFRGGTTISNDSEKVERRETR